MGKHVHIIGGGLAGCESAYYLANKNIPVLLHEMRPKTSTFAHKTGLLAELVCSNSFRSDEWEINAVGLLHKELRMAGSLIMESADRHSLPAGSALGVDRENFSAYIHHIITSHPNITICHQEVSRLKDFDEERVIIATGPLTTEPLMQEIIRLTGQEHCAFFDAIAPIIHAESIDDSIVWKQSRWDKGKDYINCPMSKSQYQEFVHHLQHAETTEFKEWEKNTPYFEGCLPIEVMAQRGVETLRFGPMKPIGLTNRHQAEQPYAVVQLRQDNASATLWNMVGFQTKMTYQAQKQVFRSIPGLEHAEFARLGGIHRNSFIKSPAVLHGGFQLNNQASIQCAGQLIGVEGYVESTAIGLLCAMFCEDLYYDRPLRYPPPTCAFGGLYHHVMNGDTKYYQPMNMNYGLLQPPPLKDNGKKYKAQERKIYLSHQAVQTCQQWLEYSQNIIGA